MLNKEIVTGPNEIFLYVEWETYNFKWFISNKVNTQTYLITRNEVSFYKVYEPLESTVEFY